MKNRKANVNNNMPSTQRYLDISEIRNDTVILKDGTLRAVLLISSINFALKSEEEQEAIIQGYVSFLNSLDFPLQIVIQSRKLNIEPYLEDLRYKQKKQINDLLKIQMADYIDFVKELVELGDIMKKSFYIVVPYNPMGDKKRGFFSRISDLFLIGTIVRLKSQKFSEYREGLFRRVDKVISALNSIGIKSAPLDTQSLIELYYNSYNPLQSDVQKLNEVDKLSVE